MPHEQVAVPPLPPSDAACAFMKWARRDLAFSEYAHHDVVCGSSRGAVAAFAEHPIVVRLRGRDFRKHKKTPLYCFFSLEDFLRLRTCLFFQWTRTAVLV